MITVLFSGGLDSTTLAELARTKGELHSLLFFCYGQDACSNELTAALSYSTRHQVHLEIVTLPMVGLEAMNGTGSGPRIVAGRNLIMLAMAANYAAAAGVDRIWYGATAADHQYPDCSPAFLGSLADLVSLDTGLIVEAPFIRDTKEEVLEMAQWLDIDLDSIWYCYEPTDQSQPCGICGSCLAHPLR